MGANITDILINWIILFTYSATCLLTVIFTFSIDLYRRIEEKANLEILSDPIINPLSGGNLNWLDAWLQENHKIVGPILAFFSVIDLRFWVKFINVI